MSFTKNKYRSLTAQRVGESARGRPSSERRATRRSTHTIYSSAEILFFATQVQQQPLPRHCVTPWGWLLWVVGWHSRAVTPGDEGAALNHPASPHPAPPPAGSCCTSAHSSTGDGVTPRKTKLVKPRGCCGSSTSLLWHAALSRHCQKFQTWRTAQMSGATTQALQPSVAENITRGKRDFLKAVKMLMSWRRGSDTAQSKGKPEACIKYTCFPSLK